MAHDALARGCQRQAAAHALEQRLAQRQFQLVQHLAGGGLGHVQLLRGRAQGAAVVDGKQQHDLPHAQPGQQGRDIQVAFHD
ncbi:hypothetical protein G6F62_015622 [Rhizopus arrhizus]|nr:hypothetical protein G6F62_015622 [Rhizopus arrhizus]